MKRREFLARGLGAAALLSIAPTIPGLLSQPAPRLWQDGFHDDAPWIQAQLDALGRDGGTLYLKPGAYYIRTPIIIGSEQGSLTTAYDLDDTDKYFSLGSVPVQSEGRPIIHDRPQKCAKLIAAASMPCILRLAEGTSSYCSRIWFESSQGLAKCCVRVDDVFSGRAIEYGSFS